jgi:dihydrofolate reductase
MSKDMKVSIIAAVAKNRVIGNCNALPWRLQTDSRFFRMMTIGHHVIMGRKTYQSIGKPLAGRPNIVVSRDPGFEARCPVATSVEAALLVARESGETEAFVIGGAEIYRLALPLADTLYITKVLANVEGDAFFPRFDESEWKVRPVMRVAADENNEHPCLVSVLEREVNY